jgi:NAD(P)-dependent dehydrogenase (short-subunit alcohol dehydrogenase family)
VNAPRIFVTGAAAGIGLATTRRFLRDGWVVGAYDIDAAALGTLEGTDLTGRLVTGHLDVTDPTEWATRLAEFSPDGRLDVLVNNAGVLSSGRFEEIDLEAHRRIIEVNVLGTVNGAHAAHRYLAATRGSLMVNMCSASAIYGQPELATYSASKFAIRGLTEALELEWRAQDIGVLAMWPMFVETDMVVGMDTGATRRLGVRLSSQDVADAIAGATARRRRVLPKVHHPVGTQAQVFATAARFSPAWANRFLNKVLTGS